MVPLSIPLRFITTGLPFDLYLPTEPLIAGATLVFILKLLYDRKFDTKVLNHPISFAIYFYLTWILITSITSTMPLVSFKFLISRIWFIVTFYFIATQVFEKYRNMLTYVWCYALTMVIVIGYFLVRLYNEGLTNEKAFNWVVQPFYNDHTDYGAALAMIFPALIGIYFIRNNVDKSRRALYFIIIVIFLIGIVFSYTRAAWISLIIAFGFLIALKLKFRMQVILLLIAIAAGTFFYFQTDIELALDRNKQDSSGSLTKHIQSASNIKTDASNLERLNRWNSAFRMFKEKPIFGFGPGTYTFKYAPFQVAKDKTIISTNAGTLGNAHSEYIGPLAEQGVLGLFAFLFIILSTLFTASRIYFTAKKRKTRLLALTLVIALVTYYTHGFLNDFLDSDKLSALFWGFTAMVASLDVYHTKVKKPINS